MIIVNRRPNKQNAGELLIAAFCVKFSQTERYYR